MLDSVESWFTKRNGFFVREGQAASTPETATTITTTTTTHHAPARRSSPPVAFPISTALVLQILVLVAMIISITLFVIYRLRRQKKLKQLEEQKRMDAPLFGNISAPNGLAPPTYGEALKSPALSESSDYGHQKQRSDSVLMEECWKAVFATEDGTSDPRCDSQNTTARPGHTSHSSWDAAAARVAGRRGSRLPEPASPKMAAQPGRRRSVAEWLRSQRWIPGASLNPLNSNPASISARLPVPPSPSYNGITTSRVTTPTTATHLIAPGQTTPNQPLSARSWATGEDSVGSTTRSTFVPQTALYPPPLQAAPKGNAASRSLTEERRRSSATSWTSEIVDSYDRDSGTWKTMTPHEDPPHFEPRRGNPDEVSPI